MSCSVTRQLDGGTFVDGRSGTLTVRGRDPPEVDRRKSNHLICRNKPISFNFDIRQRQAAEVVFSVQTLETGKIL